MPSFPASFTWKSAYSAIAAGVAVLVLGLAILFSYISYNNEEVGLRHQHEAVQIDLHNILDNTNKKIKQTASVTDAQMESIKDIIVGNAQARGGSRGSLVTVLTESVPNLDRTTDTFRNLQNIIAGSRDSYAATQTRLIDIKRAHDNLLDRIPSGWFVGGRPHLENKIVTSTRVEKAFETGVDDDDSVFPAKK